MDSYFKTANLKAAHGMDGISKKILSRIYDCAKLLFLDICNKLWKSEYIPLEWLIDKCILLAKKAHPKSLNDFRDIMIQNAFYSVLDGLIANRLYNFIESHLHRSQAGFIKGLSAIDQFHNLRAVILESKYYYKKTIYLMFLDFKKMFDTVWHNGLFFKLYNSGINGKLWRMIKLIYNNSHCKLALDGVLSSVIRLHRAVKQGGKTSTTLMIIYVDDLIRVLYDAGIGVKMILLLIACLFFADDCTLLAENLNDMQLLLDIACKWAFTWGLEFNPDKCKLLRIDPNNTQKRIFH